MFLSLLHVNIGNDADRPRPGQQWLSDIYRVHQRLWMAFPDGNARAEDPFFLGTWRPPISTEPKPRRSQAGFLFRIEMGGMPRILVQSSQRPDWEYAFQNAPYLLSGTPQAREFDPDPHQGEEYRFRLLAHVVKIRSVVHPSAQTRTTRAGLTIPRRRRTEVPVYPSALPEGLPADPAERRQVVLDRWNPWREWLAKIGENRGFRVVDNSSSPLSMEARYTVVRWPTNGRRALDAQARSEKRFNAGLFDGVLVCTAPAELRKAIIMGVGHAKAFGFGLLSIARP